MPIKRSSFYSKFETGALRRFELEGFRNLGKGAGINIKQLNLFVGPNGSGKSTMLAAFQLFHSAILQGKVQRIDVGLIDRLGLVTSQDRPFTMRVFYEHAVFEYDYVIDECFNWVCQRMALRKQKENSSRSRLLVEFSLNATKCNLSGLGKHGFFGPSIIAVFWNEGSAETKQTADKLASEILSFIEAFDSRKWKDGTLVLTTKFRVDVGEEYEAKFGSSELNLVNEDNEWCRPEELTGSFFSLKSLLFILSAFSHHSYFGYSNGESLNSPRLSIKASRCKESVRKAYLEYGVLVDAEADHILVDFFEGEKENEHRIRENIKCLVAHAIISGSADKNPRLSAFMELLCDEREEENKFVNEVVNSVIEKCTHAYGSLISLRVGTSNRSFGILPPMDASRGARITAKAKALRGNFQEIISLASEYSLTSSLIENKALRAWVLNRLSDEGHVDLSIPEVGLSARISFDTEGGLHVGAKKNGKTLPSKGLSRGEQKLLLISLYREFNAFLEEPETNLHPNFHSLLGKIVSRECISKPSMTENDLEVDEDFGLIDFGEDFQGLNRKRFYWNTEAHRDYQFIETHSDILIKAIQLEMARNLPTTALWEEHPGLTPSFEEVQKQFAELDPNIEVTYFGTVNGKSVPMSMGLRRDGVFREEFGPGFYDESLQLVRDIFDLKSQN